VAKSETQRERARDSGSGSFTMNFGDTPPCVCGCYRLHCCCITLYHSPQPHPPEERPSVLSSRLLAGAAASASQQHGCSPPAAVRTPVVALWWHRHPPLQSLKRLSAAAPGCCLPPLYHSHCTCTCRDSARRRGRRRCARSPTPLSRTEFPPGDDSTRAQQVSGQSSETHVTPEASQVGRYASRGHVACDHQVAGTLAGWHGKLCTDRSKTANELFFLGVRPEHDQVRWSQVQEVLCSYSVRVALLSSDTIAVC
jgi:hypothetical protein